MKNISAKLRHCYPCNIYNVWPGPVDYEPWTIYNKSTKSCYHKPHMQTTNTTHQPSLATGSHTLLQTHQPRLSIVTGVTYTTHGLGLCIMTHGPFTMLWPSPATMTQGSNVDPQVACLSQCLTHDSHTGPMCCIWSISMPRIGQSIIYSA